MLHAGLDLSRKRIDVCLLSDQGELIEELACPPDHDGLRGLARRAGAHGEPVVGVIESMTGARFVHDTLESLGWAVEIADAAKVKGLAPLAAKTDRIDARVLALLSQRDLVPAIWLPDPRVREERELARFRLHLVKHRSQLKHRIHSTLMSFGRPCPVTDLFGVEGRELLARLEVPEPWLGNVLASLELIDCLEAQISEINSRLAAGGAEHPYVPRLLTVPGIGSVLAFTIAAEIGEISRFATPSFTRKRQARAEALYRVLPSVTAVIRPQRTRAAPPCRHQSAARRGRTRGCRNRGRAAAEATRGAQPAPAWGHRPSGIRARR